MWLPIKQYIEKKLLFETKTAKKTTQEKSIFFFIAPKQIPSNHCLNFIEQINQASALTFETTVKVFNLLLQFFSTIYKTCFFVKLRSPGKWTNFHLVVDENFAQKLFHIFWDSTWSMRHLFFYWHFQFWNSSYKSITSYHISVSQKLNWNWK